MLKNIGVEAGKFLGVRRIFAQISPNLPEKHSKENDLQDKRLHFDFECYFCKIKAHTAILRRYSHILSGFSPNQTFWGCACTPASYPSVDKYCLAVTKIQLKIWRFHGSLSQKGSRPLFHANHINIDWKSCCCSSLWTLWWHIHNHNIYFIKLMVSLYN